MTGPSISLLNEKQRFKALTGINQLKYNLVVNFFRAQNYTGIPQNRSLPKSWMASGPEMRTVSSKQHHQQQQQHQQQHHQHQQQTVSGIRLAPIESSDSSANGAKKKRLTKKRRKPKSTFLPTKIDRFSSDDESDDADKKLSKFDDDGFVSYESNSSSRSLVNKVCVNNQIMTVHTFLKTIFFSF